MSSAIQHLAQRALHTLCSVLMPHLDMEACVTPRPEAPTGKEISTARQVSAGAWEVVASGSSVEAILKAIPQAAAKAYFRSVTGKLSGKVPDEYMANTLQAWTRIQSDPEFSRLRDSVKILLYAKKTGKQPASLRSVEIKFPDGQILKVKVTANGFQQAELLLSLIEHSRFGKKTPTAVCKVGEEFFPLAEVVADEKRRTVEPEPATESEPEPAEATA